MLIPQTALSRTRRRHGRCRAGLTELRHALASPSALGDGHRRRLLALAQRLARVQALGDEYARVDWSPAVRSALARQPALA